MTPESLLARLAQTGIEEVPVEFGGPGHRCSVWLTDGTHLPCILMERVGPYADRLREIVDQELRGEGSYALTANPVREALKTQFAGSNHVTLHDVARIEPSPFAIPMRLLRQVSGETATDLWLFSLETADARRFTFRGSHLAQMLFFDLPEGVHFGDFTKVHNLRRGRSSGPTFEARPFFRCLVDDEPLEADLSLLGLE
ncbi:MAG: hypothetical protein H7124_07925 [Phycisphaerales bacterium]|nr:hypothetical protein [Hyphomonadaceae bacterium]